LVGLIEYRFEFDFTAAKRRSTEKALRKRDARNAQALRLAHVFAGRGVPCNARARRAANARAGPGETAKWFPHQNFKFLLQPLSNPGTFNNSRYPFKTNALHLK
jgi:hypothetical protein